MLLSRYPGIFTFLFLLFISYGGFAQDKKVMDHSIYDSWNSIKNVKISDNGEYSVWQSDPQDGDGFLVIHNNRTFEKK